MRALNFVFNRSEWSGGARFVCCRVIARGCVALLPGCGVALLPGCGVALLPAHPVDLRVQGEDVVEYPGKVACPSGRRCSTRNAVWCHSHPGFKSQRYRHRRPAPLGLGGFVVPDWFPSNVARNSPVACSNVEFVSLELQRFWPILKNDRVKLRAKLIWRSPRFPPRAPWPGPSPPALAAPVAMGVLHH